MDTIYLNASNLTYWQDHSKPSVIALGFFDGVHKGHQKVIQTAVNLAKEKGLSVAVMSFFPHPKTLLSREKFDYIMPVERKAFILESLGVDTFYVVNCDKNFLSLPPEQFVAEYLVELKVNHAVAGFDFTYGSQANGHIDRLQRDSLNKIGVTKVEKVDLNGVKISSTWIRHLILNGKINALSAILGRMYDTEVYWEKDFFKLSSNYILPSAGLYEVILGNHRRQHHAKIFIHNDRNCIYLVDDIHSSFHRNEKYSMMWCRKISNAQTEKAFSDELFVSTYG